MGGWTYMSNISDALKELDDMENTEKLIQESLSDESYESLVGVELSIDEFNNFMDGVIKNARP